MDKQELQQYIDKYNFDVSQVKKLADFYKNNFEEDHDAIMSFLEGLGD